MELVMDKVTIQFFQGGYWISVGMIQPVINFKMKNSAGEKKIEKAGKLVDVVKARRMLLDAKMAMFQRFSWIVGIVAPCVSFHVLDLQVFVSHVATNAIICVNVESINIASSRSHLVDSIISNEASSSPHFRMNVRLKELAITIKPSSTSSIVSERIVYLSSVDFRFSFVVPTDTMRPYFGVELYALLSFQVNMDHFELDSSSGLRELIQISSINDSVVKSECDTSSPIDLDVFHELPFDAILVCDISSTVKIVNKSSVLELTLDNFRINGQTGVNTEIICVFNSVVSINSLNVLTASDFHVTASVVKDFISHLKFTFDLDSIQFMGSSTRWEMLEFIDKISEIRDSITTATAKSTQSNYSSLKLLCIPISFDLRLHRFILQFEENPKCPLVVFFIHELNVSFARDTAVLFSSNVPMNSVVSSRSLSLNFELISVLLLPLPVVDLVSYVCEVSSGRAFRTIIQSNPELGILFLWNQSNMFLNCAISFPESPYSLDSLILHPPGQELVIKTEFDCMINFGKTSIEIPYHRICHVLDMIFHTYKPLLVLSAKKKNKPMVLVPPKFVRNMKPLYRFLVGLKLALKSGGFQACFATPLIWPKSELLKDDFADFLDSSEDYLSSVTTCHGDLNPKLSNGQHYILLRDAIFNADDSSCSFECLFHYDRKINIQNCAFEYNFKCMSLSLDHRSIAAFDVCPCYKELENINFSDSHGCSMILPQSHLFVIENFGVKVEIERFSGAEAKYFLISTDINCFSVVLSWNISNHAHLLATKYFFVQELLQKWNSTGFKELQAELFMSDISTAVSLNEVRSRSDSASIDEYMLRVRYNIKQIVLALDFSDKCYENLELKVSAVNVTSVSPPASPFMTKTIDYHPSDVRNLAPQSLDNINNVWPSSSIFAISPEWVRLGSFDFIEGHVNIPIINTCFHEFELNISDNKLLTSDAVCLSLTQHSLSESFPMVNYSDLLNLGLSFNTIALFLNRKFNVMDAIDNILDHWKVVKNFVISWPMSSKIDLNLVETLDLANFRFQCRYLSILFQEENPLDIVLRCKRLLALNETSFESEEKNRGLCPSTSSVVESEIIRTSWRDLSKSIYIDSLNSGEESVSHVGNLHKKVCDLFGNVAVLEFHDFELDLQILPEYLDISEAVNFALNNDTLDYWKPGTKYDSSTQVLGNSILNSTNVKECWVRRIVLKSGELSLRLRDFPLPLFFAETANISGEISGVTPRHLERFFVPIKKCFCFSTVNLFFNLDKTGPPMKIYHSLNVSLKKPRISYGVCYDPTLTDFSIATDRLSNSKSAFELHYWDNFRYKYHGTLTLNLIEPEIRILASDDPRNCDHLLLKCDDIKLDYFARNFRLTAAKMKFDVCTKVLESFDDSILFQSSSIIIFPRIMLLTRLEWTNGNSTSDFVIPVTNHYLHAIADISGQKRPMKYFFNQYRATGLSFYLKFVVKPADSRPSHRRTSSSCEISDTIPLVYLEWPTLHWLGKLQSLYADPPDWLKPSKRMLESKTSLSGIIDEFRMEFAVTSPSFEVRQISSTEADQRFRFDDTRCVQFHCELLNIKYSIFHRVLAPKVRSWAQCEFSLNFNYLNSIIYVKVSDDSIIPGSEVEHLVTSKVIQGRRPVFFFSASSVSYVSSFPIWYKPLKRAHESLNEIFGNTPLDDNKFDQSFEVPPSGGGTPSNLPFWVDKTPVLGGMDHKMDELLKLDKKIEPVLLPSSKDAAPLTHTRSLSTMDIRSGSKPLNLNDHESGIWSRRHNNAPSKPLVAPNLSSNLNIPTLSRNDMNHISPEHPGIASKSFVLPRWSTSAVRETKNDILSSNKLQEVTTQSTRGSNFVVRELKLLWTLNIRRSLNEWFKILDSNPENNEVRDNSKFEADPVSPEAPTSDPALSPNSTLKSPSADMLSLLDFNDEMNAENTRPSAGSLSKNDNIPRKKSNVSNLMFASGQTYVPSSKSQSRFNVDSEGSVGFDFDFGHLDFLSSLQRKVAADASSSEILYTIELYKPQLNFQSEESNSRMVLVAASANLVCVGTHLVFRIKENQLQEKLYTIPTIGHHKKEISASLVGVQLFISPLDVDVDGGIQWVPNSLIGDVPKKLRKTLGSGILRQILEPTPLFFSYSYDCELESGLNRMFNSVPEGITSYTSFLNSQFALLFSEQVIPLEDEQLLLDLITKLRKQVSKGSWRRQFTSFTQLFLPHLKIQVTSDQFQSLLDIVQNVLLYDLSSEEGQGFDTKKADSKDADMNILHEIIVPPLPTDPNELKTLLEIALNEKTKALLRNQNSGKSEGKVIEFGLGLVTWALRENETSFIEASLSGLHSHNSFHNNGSKSILFEIHEVKFRSCQENAVFRDVIGPVETLWKKRDKIRERLVSVRAEICPPPIYTLNLVPQLRNITFWDLLEVKFFPVAVKLSHEIYSPIRRYFFPVKTFENITKEETTDFLSPKGPLSKHVHGRTLSTISKNPIISNSLRTSSSHLTHDVNIDESEVSTESNDESCHYFQYMRIGDVEVVLSFRSPYMDVTEKPLMTSPFILNSRLLSTLKLIGKIESQFVVDGLKSMTNRKELLKRLNLHQDQVVEEDDHKKTGILFGKIK